VSAARREAAPSDRPTELPDLARHFGANLRRQRRRAGLSQEELALRAALHRTEIGNLENGLRIPRLDTILKAAGGIEADPCELLDGIAWRASGSRDGGFELAPRLRPGPSAGRR
jgi:transcriptional regulator with XRE-family HTH domain